jgi:hypothetical protein
MIKTLWTLKNMDKIQEDAQYAKSWPMSFYNFPGHMQGSFYLHNTLQSRPGTTLTYTPGKGGGHP